MKTMKERMRLFHDNAGPLHKEVDERISKVDKKRAKRVAVALTMATAVLVGSLFSGPEDITGSNAQEIMNPTPIVLDIGSVDADVQDEEPAPEEAKKSGIKARLRAAILAMPRWVRACICVPLWGLGYALLLLGSFLKTILTPFAGVLLSGLIGIAVMIGLFGVTAKLLFPDMPWKKIFSKTNLIVLIATGIALTAADIIVPRYYSGYPYVAAAVKFTAALVVINILLARLKALAEKFA
ncbi:MAG: hypothetical protein J6X24_00725 [Firmicutes bacterium]|nr:hypothetical protein [Bacillota bacterium]